MSSSSVTPTPRTPTARASTASESRRSMVIVVLAVFLLLGGTITILGVTASGNVSGTEFSPRTFATRSFGYWEIPLLHWQVTPVIRTPQSGVMEDLLQKEKLLPPASPNAAEVWHLVSLERSAVTVQEGDAKLLVNYLGSPTMFGTKSDSVEWTEKNPELAKVFWPIVARLAERNEYLLVPDLFELARGTKTPAQLKSAIHEHLAKRYQRWAKVEHDLNHQPMAVELLDEALLHAKDSPNLHRELTKNRGQWLAE